MTQAQNPVVVSAITLAFGAAATLSQLQFGVSIAFETLPMLENKKFKMSQFARDVEAASGYTICARSVANVGSLAARLQEKFGTKIAAYDGGHTVENVNAFCDFIRAELQATTYTLAIGDLVAFCKGEASAADKRAKEQANKDAIAQALRDKETQAELNKLSEEADSKLAASEKAKKDAEDKLKAEADKLKEAEAKAEKEKADKLEAEKRAEALAKAAREKELQAEADKLKAAAAEAEAEVLRKERDSFALKVSVDAKGNPVISYADNMSPEFLDAVAKSLKLQASAIRRAQAQAMKQAA